MSDLRFDGTPITDAELLDIWNKHKGNATTLHMAMWDAMRDPK